jgi:GNAT superfamily N-acetyltransferase
MTRADIPLGMRLKEQAGWNQLEADWQRFLDLEPEGCFVAELDGVEVGTVTTCLFGPVAWIAMVLVDTAHRRRGVGNALMGHALDFLDRRGVNSIRLDATSLGQPLYEKLGFATEYQLARYEGILPGGSPAPQVLAIQAGHLPDLTSFDREATATDREKLLRRLHGECPQEMRVVLVEGAVGGYLTSRPGARAWQIGPCLASAQTGPLLFADVDHRHGGRPVYVDIPVGNEPASSWARARGLTVQRTFIRMCRGPIIGDRVESLWASSGPEVG